MILDEPRDVTRFKSANGYFGDVRIVDCPPGYGFVCTLGTMEKSLLRVQSLDGVESWLCHACHHANATPRIDSVLEYLNLSLPNLDALVRCEQCATVRVWYCPRASCAECAPLEVAEIGTEPDDGTARPQKPRTASSRGAASKAPTTVVSRKLVTSMLETFTCPRCMLPPTDCWPCPQCDT